jgi:hypothetical protein
VRLSAPYAVIVGLAASLLSASTLAADVSVRVFNSTPIDVPDNTAIKLTFDRERFDTSRFHDISNPGVLVVPVTGKYMIYCSAFFPTNGAGARSLGIIRNGSQELAFEHKVAAQNYYTYLNVFSHFRLIAGDSIEFQAVQDSGVTLQVGGPPNNKSPECGMFKSG